MRDPLVPKSRWAIGFIHSYSTERGNWNKAGACSFFLILHYSRAVPDVPRTLFAPCNWLGSLVRSLQIHLQSGHFYSTDIVSIIGVYIGSRVRILIHVGDMSRSGPSLFSLLSFDFIGQSAPIYDTQCYVTLSDCWHTKIFPSRTSNLGFETSASL